MNSYAIVKLYVQLYVENCSKKLHGQARGRAREGGMAGAGWRASRHVAGNHFQIWGGGVDNSVLWLSFAQQKLQRKRGMKESGTIFFLKCYPQRCNFLQILCSKF
jgi:hypothetical protein